MLPVIPGLGLRLWDAANFGAILILLFGGLSLAKHRDIPREVISAVWRWAVVGGVFGAHIYWLLAARDVPYARLTLGQILNPFAGSAIQGGIIGGTLAALVCLRRRSRPILPVLDVLAPAGALSHASTRLGCFAAGCCFGAPTSLPIGVTYTHKLAAHACPRGIALHPAQLYESVLDAALAVFLYRRLRSRGAPGGVFSFYVIGYGLVRFVVQFFRSDDAGRLLFGMAHSQYMAAAMVVFGLWLLRKTKDLAAPEVP